MTSFRFRFMASLITCADTNKMDDWIEDDANNAKNESLQTFVICFFTKICACFDCLVQSRDYLDLFGTMTKMIDLTEREFYALAILNYCEIGEPRETITFSPSDLEIFQTHRSIFLKK